MFREMRRKEKSFTQEVCVEILEQSTSGVLSVLGDEGYPYGVPVNHIYLDGKIYFHCATEGHKLDAIEKDPRVSFCVIALEEIIQHKFSTRYRSVVAFGKAHIVTDPDERMKAFEVIISRLTPDFIKEGGDYIRSAHHKAHIVCIDIDHMTGKGAK